LDDASQEISTDTVYQNNEQNKAMEKQNYLHEAAMMSWIGLEGLGWGFPTVMCSFVF